MNEWVIIALLTISGALFAIGGTGLKWSRRYILPVVIGALIAHSVPLWANLGYVLTLSAVLHLGYGERAKWWYRLLIFCGYSLPCLFFGWSWWIVLTPILCYLWFVLSNFKPTERMFPWKIVEFIYGFLISVSLITTINGGMVWKF